MDPSRLIPNVPSHVPAELVIDFDAFNDSKLEVDVFKRWGEVRDSAPPIAFSPCNGGHWIVFRGDDITTVLTDAEHFSNAHFNAVSSGGPGFIPLGLDPPEHTPWRLLLLKYFSPARVRELEGVIREKAEELISPLAAAKTCDFVTAVAEPMPVAIFMELLGLPVERLSEFRSLALLALNPFGDSSKTAEANRQIVGILSELIAARSQERKNDLVSALLDETVKGAPIGGAELMSICYVLFIGGLDTVTNAMSFGIRQLAQNPSLQDAIRNDLSQIPDVMEKLLRRSAFAMVSRSVKRDTRLGGVQLKAGDLLFCMTWAGSNESGGETEGPRHLAFGGGYHVCLGMHLARLELKIMYETWFKRIARFSLAPDEEPTMRGGPIMHLKRLRLNLEPLPTTSDQQSRARQSE